MWKLSITTLPPEHNSDLHIRHERIYSSCCWPRQAWYRSSHCFLILSPTDLEWSVSFLNSLCPLYRDWFQISPGKKIPREFQADNHLYSTIVSQNRNSWMILHEDHPSLPGKNTFFTPLYEDEKLVMWETKTNEKFPYNLQPMSKSLRQAERLSPRNSIPQR